MFVLRELSTNEIKIYFQVTYLLMSPFSLLRFSTLSLCILQVFFPAFKTHKQTFIVFSLMLLVAPPNIY